MAYPYYKTTSTNPPEENPLLNEFQLKELSIIKQAILKSAIEGRVIKKIKDESDEEFIVRWVKFCRRNEVKDKELYLDQDQPF